MPVVLQNESRTWARRFVTWCFLRETLQRLNPSLPLKPLTEQRTQPEIPFLRQHLYFFPFFALQMFSHCLVVLCGEEMVLHTFQHRCSLTEAVMKPPVLKKQMTADRMRSPRAGAHFYLVWLYCLLTLLTILFVSCLLSFSLYISF